MTRIFLDTNILVYAVDKRDPAKYERAIVAVEKQIGDGSGVISTQVLQEFASVALGKLHQRVDVVMAELLAIESLEVVQLTPALIRRGLEFHSLHQMNFGTPPFWPPPRPPAARGSGPRISSPDRSTACSASKTRWRGRVPPDDLDCLADFVRKEYDTG